MTLDTTARPEMIERLIDAGFAGMERAGLDSSATEMASAIFTMCARIINYSVNVKDPASRARNVQVARNAVWQLQMLLPSSSTSIN